MSNPALLRSLRPLSLPTALQTPICSSRRRVCAPGAQWRLQLAARAKSTRAAKALKNSTAPAPPPASPATTGSGAGARTARAKSNVTAAGEQQTLSWPEYLTIRKKKRRWETAMTIPFTVGGFAGGVAYFGNLEMDPTKPIFNLDPMIVYGFATLACGGLGYLIGPIVGSSVWRLTHRRTLKLIEARDREFHQHIVKNRVDPTAQSATNPVPDFYGEKIGSLHGYRQWLRDQSKYKRKAYLPEDV